MSDNQPIPAGAARRLLADLEATSPIDPATDELIDRGLADLLAPDEIAVLQAHLRENSHLADVYREREADLREQLTSAHLDAAGERMHAWLLKQIPELHPPEPVRVDVPPRFVESVRRFSEAVRELTKIFSYNVLVVEGGALSDPRVEESSDQTAAITIAPRPAGGVRFVVTSYNAEDDAAQVEFSLHPTGDWRKTVILKRSLPNVDVWEGVLELSSAELAELSGPEAREIRIRPLLS